MVAQPLVAHTITLYGVINKNLLKRLIPFISAKLSHWGCPYDITHLSNKKRTVECIQNMSMKFVLSAPYLCVIKDVCIDTFDGELL